MIHISVSFVLVLRCFGRAVDGKAVLVKLDGQDFRPEYRDGGYLVFVNIPGGTHEVELRSAAYQNKTVSVQKSATKLNSVIVNLTPKQPRANLSVQPKIIKLSQDCTEIGATNAKFYCAEKMYDLPCEFIVDDGDNSEKCVISDIADGLLQFEKPLTKPHKRGAAFTICND
ncbi:hypothetical protein FACS1894133_1790 [Clostridia bacterium]|nr:hypothetical protein FACS1894133_1790 [Clostridia bacterium]